METNTEGSGAISKKKPRPRKSKSVRSTSVLDGDILHFDIEWTERSKERRRATKNLVSLLDDTQLTSIRKVPEGVISTAEKEINVVECVENIPPQKNKKETLKALNTAEVASPSTEKKVKEKKKLEGNVLAEIEKLASAAAVARKNKHEKIVGTVLERLTPSDVPGPSRTGKKTSKSVDVEKQMIKCKVGKENDQVSQGCKAIEEVLQVLNNNKDCSEGQNENSSQLEKPHSVKAENIHEENNKKERPMLEGEVSVGSEGSEKKSRKAIKKDGKKVDVKGGKSAVGKDVTIHDIVIKVPSIIKSVKTAKNTDVEEVNIFSPVVQHADSSVGIVIAPKCSIVPETGMKNSEMVMEFKATTSTEVTAGDSKKKKRDRGKKRGESEAVAAKEKDKRKRGSETEVKTENKSVQKIQPLLDINIDSDVAKKLARASDLKKRAIYRFPNYLSRHELTALQSYNLPLIGILRINQKLPNSAYVTVPGLEHDIFIKGMKDRNRALHNDQVIVMLRPELLERKQREETLYCGVVVAITSYNHNRICVGTLNPMFNSKRNAYGILTPTDMRLPLLKIPGVNLPAEFKAHPMDFQDTLYACRIISWENIQMAEGGELYLLGKAGTAKSETEAILLKHSLLVTEYPPHYTRYYPCYPYTIPEDEYKKRTVGSNACVFTIDPATAKDLDDAVSCDLLGNGNYVVGVHIADVSYFLKEGTELDRAVAERATTIYLVDQVYHMLPRDLCQICSLCPGEDKLAFSIFWEMTPDGKIVNRRFEKTIINSCAQLSYELVQAILDGEKPILPPIENGQSEENVIATVRILHKLSEVLRMRRVENGALRIDQVKISFILDPVTRQPIDYVPQLQLASHRLIEEFMLLANCSVAEIIQERHPDLALLRSHPPPNASMLKRLQTRLEGYGLSLDISSSRSLQTSLSRICDDFGDNSLAMVVYHALTKPMMRAKYFCSGVRPSKEDRHHFALSVPLYTHFTSPIRRYADIIVHRILSSALNITGKPQISPLEIEQIASNCNDKKQNAKLAQDSSTELFLAIYVGNREPLVVQAIVSYVCQNNLECLLQTGHVVSVYYDKIDGKVTRVEQNKTMQVHIQWKDGTKQIVDTFSILTLELTRGKGILLNARIVPPLSAKSIEQTSPPAINIKLQRNFKSLHILTESCAPSREEDTPRSRRSSSAPPGWPTFPRPTVSSDVSSSPVDSSLTNSLPKLSSILSFLETSPDCTPATSPFTHSPNSSMFQRKATPATDSALLTPHSSDSAAFPAPSAPT